MRAISKTMAGVVTLAMAGGLVAATAGIANAAYNPSAPPYPADANNVASLTIFDATTGAIVTSGSSSTALSNYYFVSSTDFGAPDGGSGRKAALFGYLAEPGKAPGAFSGSGLGAATTFPVATAPAPVNGFTTPTAKGGSSNTFAALASSFPHSAGDASTDFDQLYQLRVKTTFPTPQSITYAYGDIKIDTVNGTWTQVSPQNPPLPPAAPAKPTATAGDTTADVSVPTVAGATSYTVTSSPGAIVKTGAAGPFHFTGLTNGTAYTFTATATNANGTSGSSPASDPVTPRPATTTVVSLSGGPYDTNTDVTISATVTQTGTGSPVTAGTVSFTDAIDGALGSSPVDGSGVATLPTKRFSAGSGHRITASYTDSSGAALPSSGQSSSFDVAYVPTGACSDPNSQCSEAQYFKATVAAGSLVISTPYTDAAHAFDLGNLTLNDDGTLLSVTKAFGSSAIPAAADQPNYNDPVSAYASKYSGVTIVDRRPGQVGWTANLNSSDFITGTPAAPGNVIDGHNLGFTGVTAAYIPGNGLSDNGVAAADVTLFDNPAANGVAPGATSGGVKGVTKFASANAGDSAGTVYVYGNMTLNAPTSTPAGLYTATVTFTIV